MKRLKLGCIADDFTGASDVASFLEAEGIKTVLISGVPEGKLNEDVEAVVIALKTRTETKDRAVSMSLEALRYLMETGTEKFYFKYCSTFDSTSEGNIGPVLDAFMDELGVERTIICPSLPVNGRTVTDGKLYVHGELLEESSMQNHPLTPMNESDLKLLMESQSRYKAFNIFEETLFLDSVRIKDYLRDLKQQHDKFYVIPDYAVDKHGERIIEIFGDDILFSGGSGLIVHLARKLKENEDKKNESDKILILAGSCSTMTIDQIRTYKELGGKSLKLSPSRIARKEETAGDIWKKISDEDVILVYSSEDIETRLVTDAGSDIAGLIESVMGQLAVKARNNGYSAIIVAGGETSGAVTKELGVNRFQIGRSISPGVPVLLPEDENYSLVLKSGNFGNRYFFVDSVAYFRRQSYIDHPELMAMMKGTIEIAKSLFDRGKTAGTSANISFRYNDLVFISRSGSCFGTLCEDDFAIVTMTGFHINDLKPSKELPLHLSLYNNDDTSRAVIHTHSFYATLWSCLDNLNENDAVPAYTPYLNMKLGQIKLIPYSKPGTPELFSLFEKHLTRERGYILKNHGPIVAGKSMFQAFEGLEELEESARIAWYLRNDKAELREV